MIFSASRVQKNVPSTCTPSMRRQPASVVLTVPSRKVSTGPPRAISSACFRRSAMIWSASLRPSRPLMPALLTRMSSRGLEFLDLLEHCRHRGRIRHVGRHGVPAQGLGGGARRLEVQVVDDDASRPPRRTGGRWRRPARVQRR